VVAALAFLAAYAIPILHPGLPRWLGAACWWTTWVTWMLFVADYLVRLVLAESRRTFVVRHWLDLIVIALPLLRPLRLLRLIPLLSVINRRATTRLQGRVATYVVGGALLLAFVGALAELNAERDAPGATIVDFGDAIWWATTTMTTVGYGDTYPVTVVGRWVAAALMVGGVALLGTVTATFASWLVDRVSTVSSNEEELRATVARLEAKLDSLIDQRSSDAGRPHVDQGPLPGA
jgi:voltage-gated potassium channel